MFRFHDPFLDRGGGEDLIEGERGLVLVQGGVFEGCTEGFGRWLGKDLGGEERIEVFKCCAEAIGVIEVVKHLGLGDGARSFGEWNEAEADPDFTLDKNTELIGDQDEVVVGAKVDGDGEVVDVLAERVELAWVDAAEELSPRRFSKKDIYLFGHCSYRGYPYSRNTRTPIVIPHILL